MTQTTQKIQSIAQIKLNIKPEIQESKQKLVCYSLIEIFPIFNIPAAICEALELSKLSEMREANDNSINRKNYALKKYQFKFGEKDPKRDKMANILILIDNIFLELTKPTFREAKEGVITSCLNKLNDGKLLKKPPQEILALAIKDEYNIRLNAVNATSQNNTSNLTSSVQACNFLKKVEKNFNMITKNFDKQTQST